VSTPSGPDAFVCVIVLYWTRGQGQESGQHPQEWADEAQAEADDLAISAAEDVAAEGLVDGRDAPDAEVAGEAGVLDEVREGEVAWVGAERYLRAV